MTDACSKGTPARGAGVDHSRFISIRQVIENRKLFDGQVGFNLYHFPAPVAHTLRVIFVKTLYHYPVKIEVTFLADEIELFFVVIP
jgi:hypothetical protein